MNRSAKPTNRGEQIVPLRVHGITVAIDWDSSLADGSCIEACPVQVFQWYRSEQGVPAADMKNAECRYRRRPFPRWP
jgi:NAD-dependent dihydropyrimidine dehydrogenase PreA subunit